MKRIAGTAATLLLAGVMLSVMLFMMAGCSEKNNSGENEAEGKILEEAEKIVNDELKREFRRLGIETEKAELEEVKFAAEVPFSQGGNFEFYEIGFRIKMKNPEQKEQLEKAYGMEINLDEEGWISGYPVTGSDDGGLIFMSAYNDDGEYYEFRSYRGVELQQPVKNGQYNHQSFENIVKYIYEDITSMETAQDYSLNVQKSRISIGENFKGQLPLEGAQITKSEAEDLMYIMAGYKELWQTKEIQVETYGFFENQYEPIYRVFTENPKVSTPKGISPGSSKEELFTAYGQDNLVFTSSSFGGESFNAGYGYRDSEEPKEWAGYGFTGQDETQYYILFYMEGDNVAAVEMGTGYDRKPFERQDPKYPLEIEELIDDHIDEPQVMKYDVTIPKIKDSVAGSENINALLQYDFQKIIDFSQKGQYEVITQGIDYPWVEIKYDVSNLGEMSILNVFTTYSSATGARKNVTVKSYYYDTTCGARLSEEAAMYRLGYSKETLKAYFEFKYPEAVSSSEGDGSVNKLVYFFNDTGEPVYII